MINMMRRTRGLRSYGVALVIAVLLFQSAQSFAASRDPVGATHGLVVTAHALASRVGVDILKKGGNAVDAAIAVGYALAVVFPAAGNLGGGGFMTLHLADGREAFIDFREKMSRVAAADTSRGRDRTVDPKLVAGVPGTVAGLEMAREIYGVMARATLIAPAIALATEGSSCSIRAMSIC